MEKVPPRYMIIMNNLLEAVAVKDMSRLNLTAFFATEAISLLGQFQFDETRLKDLARQIDSDTGENFPGNYLAKNLGSSDLLIFGSFKHLICGFDAKDVKTILENDDVAKFLLPIFGTLKSCPNQEILKQMAEKAMSIHGAVSEWDAPVIMSLGIIVAGLSPGDFSKIGECCVNSISRETFSHLNLNQIEALGHEKIMLLPPESLSALATNHMKAKDGSMLSKDSVMALNMTIETIGEHYKLEEAAQALLAIQELLQITEENLEETSTAESSSGHVGTNVILTALLICIAIFKPNLQ